MEENSNVKDSQLNNGPKKKRKKKHRLLKFLIVILIICVGIKIFNLTKKHYEQRKFDELIKEKLIMSEIEKIELTSEELKQDFYGDGLTNQEKIEMGLDILSEDSDGDGLTDYDEIHIYKSDPTKFSTSGDVLSDAEKIQKGYDVNKFYSDSCKVETGNSNVQLTADEATDTEAYYKEYTGSVPSEYILGMQPFRIYSFTGRTEVKIEDPEYYEVISYDNINKKETKLKYETTESAIIFDIQNDNPILIVYKQNILKKLGQNVASNLGISNNKDSEFILMAVPFATVFFDVPIYIFEVNDSVFKNNNNIILQQQINAKFNGTYNVVVSYIHSLAVKIVDFFFGGIEDKMESMLASEGVDRSFMDYIFVYRHFYSTSSLEEYLYGSKQSNEDNNTEKEEIITYEFENKYKNTKGNYYADSGFSVTKNAFKFSNIITPRANGVCMGFAHITSNIYNHGNLRQKIDDEYDLTGSAYNSIWSKMLYLYNPTSELANYADNISNNETTLEAENMEKPDSEVVKVLEYYYEKMNNELRMKKFGWALNDSFDKQSHIKESTVDNLVKTFKNGNIATVFLLGDSQHAVNAYKIVEDTNDPDILYLKIYDNNFPADMWWNQNRDGKVKYDVTITLKRCYKKTLLGGVKSYYLYDYNPLNSDISHYGNIDGGTDFVMFFDKNGNEI